MKIIYAILVLCAASSSAFAQSVDENGRTPTQRAAQSSVEAPKPLLEETNKTADETTINYHLPENVKAGEIIVFHPSRDLVLKTIGLAEKQGAVKLLTREFEVKGVVIGIYADKKLLGTKKVNF